MNTEITPIKQARKTRVSIFCFAMLLVAFGVIFYSNGKPLINTVILLCTGMVIAVILMLSGKKKKKGGTV